MSGTLELIARRDLLLNLIRVELSARYRTTLLGVAWFVLTPLVLTVVLTVVFTVVFSVGIPDYPVFVLAGLLPWTFFQMGLLNATSSVSRSPGLIKRARMPRVYLPMAAIGGNLAQLLVSLVILLGLMLVLGTPIRPGLLLLPIAVASSVLAVSGPALLTSALNVPYRDVEMLVNSGMRVLFYLSPIIYPVAYVPEPWRPLYLLNPMAGPIETWRALVMEGALPELTVMAIPALSGAVLLVLGILVFRRGEPTFEDHV